MAEVDAACVLATRGGLDLAALESWLRSRAVDASGEVWSWVSDRNPGYAYPEVAGLWLGCFGPDERVARWLSRQVSQAGGVGRGGVEYVFDTAIALNGLLEHRARGGTVDEALLARMFEFIADCLRHRVACRGGDPQRRWSSQWSPHLLKVAIALERYGRHSGEPRCREGVSQLLSDFLPWEQNGWFPVERGVPCTYVHANCYAVEALLYFDEMGDRSVRSPLRACADALALQQEPEGGMPAWSGSGATTVIRADATAQAVRIWSGVDATRFADNIAGALRALSSLQVPSGAVLYEPGSADENSWASLFAWQALRWLGNGVRISCLV